MSKYKTFKQYDSRWGSKGYPWKPDTMATSGCGPTSIANIIIHRQETANKTPNNVRIWLMNNNYCISGAGTAWDGIPAGLRHYGFKVKECDTMTQLFNECEKKPHKYGILLLSAGKAPDGRIFTTGGHYIAFTSYKKKNDRHYLYLRDSGSRDNSGWICYESSIKGLVAKAWTCYKKPVEYIKPKTGRVYTTTSALYIRKGPNKKFKKVKKIAAGTEVLCYETEGSCMRIGSNKWIYYKSTSKKRNYIK